MKERVLLVALVYLLWAVAGVGIYLFMMTLGGKG